MYPRFRREEVTGERIVGALRRRIADLPDWWAWRLPAGRAKTNRRRLQEFRDIHLGKRCFILGNGPSLARMDLAQLRNEFTFGANRIYLAEPETGFLPTCLVCSNELVLEQFHSEMATLNMPKFFTWRSRRLFSERRDDVLFFRLGFDFVDSFRKDPRRTLSSGGTVTFVSMQLAYYMGFREVILVGVDHNFVYSGTPNSAETRREERDENHFHPDYFPKGSRWQLPDLVRSELAYATARDAYRRAGGRIVDATVGGRCPVFEKAEFANIVGG